TRELTAQGCAARGQAGQRRILDAPDTMCSPRAVLYLDHVVLLARDVDTSAARLAEQFGLASCEGGTHPGGTRTRIVPLQPPHYLELLSVTRNGEAPLASWLASQLDERGDHVAAWTVRTYDIELDGRSSLQD